jgi:hypothetical protein
MGWLNQAVDNLKRYKINSERVIWCYNYLHANTPTLMKYDPIIVEQNGVRVACYVCHKCNARIAIKE